MQEFAICYRESGLGRGLALPVVPTSKAELLCLNTANKGGFPGSAQRSQFALIFFQNS
jgi:hypothetical protein